MYWENSPESPGQASGEERGGGPRRAQKAGGSREAGAGRRAGEREKELGEGREAAEKAATHPSTPAPLCLPMWLPESQAMKFLRKLPGMHSLEKPLGEEGGEERFAIFLLPLPYGQGDPTAALACFFDLPWELPEALRL